MKTRKIKVISLGILSLVAAIAFQNYYLTTHPALREPITGSPTRDFADLPPSNLLSNAGETELKQIENAVAQKPKDTQQRWRLADAYQRAGNLVKAGEQLRAIVALEPHKLAGHLALGDLALAQGHATSAESAYRQCLRVSPKSPQAWLGLASALNQQKRHFEALESARKAVAVAPKNPSTNLLLAATALDFAAQFPYHQKTHVAELTLARRLFEKSLKTWPDTGNLYLRLGTACLALKDTRAAIIHLRRAVQLLPNEAAPNVLLGRTLMRAGQREAAFEHVASSIKRYPADAELQSMMAKLWRGRSQPEALQRSYDCIRLAVNLAPDNSEYQETLGLAALRLKKIPEARVAFENALKLNRFSRVPYLQLAAINNQIGQTKAATNYAKQSSQVNAQEAQLRDVESLVKAYPKDASLRLALGDWYAERGLIAPARDTFLQALRLQPRSKVLQSRLAAAERLLKTPPALN